MCKGLPIGIITYIIVMFCCTCIVKLHNPFPPSVPIWHRLTDRHFDFNLRRDHQKTSFERRDYESVDEKSLSLAMSRKTIKIKRIQDEKG